MTDTALAKFLKLIKMKQKQTATLIFILATSITLMLSGCATPVSVKHVDIPTAYRIQTASAISST
jgi:hypothetical protein